MHLILINYIPSASMHTLIINLYTPTLYNLQNDNSAEDCLIFKGVKYLMLFSDF